MKFMTPQMKNSIAKDAELSVTVAPPANVNLKPSENDEPAASAAGGGYVTVLGRKRKVVAKGRVECVMVKGKLTPLKEAKAAERKRKA